MALAVDPAAWRRHGAMPEAWSAFAGMALHECLGAACRHPAGNPALVGTGSRIERPDLLERIARIAAHVRAAVPPGGVIAACLPQSPDGVAGLLGCAASGRICVALNADDPAERIRQIVSDAAPTAVLFDDRLPPPAGAAKLPLSACQGAPPAAPPPAADPDAPCMIHYTSGSSGRPKGIVLSSHTVLIRVAKMLRTMALGPGDRLLVPTSISDASSVANHIAALCAGATKLVASVTRDGPRALLHLAARERATVFAATAALARSLRSLAAFPAAVAQLRLVRFGGAGITGADIAEWRAVLPAECVIAHSFGSTEALLASDWTIPADTPASALRIAVGRPYPGVAFALVDADGRAVNAGETGELLLRGRHVALGEWQAGRVVEGRVTPDAARPGERAFATGDKLRFDDAGLLHFAGRADRQIKLNGVRIELAEIEAVLRAAPGVTDAAVVMAEGGLHAFVAGAEAVRPALAQAVREALPSVMRPRRIEIVAALPLLASGKPDLVALRRRAEER